MSHIAPSILAADFCNLQRDIRSVEKAGARYLHIDVMDGHFVPNLTIGPPVLRSIRKVTDMFLDVHLMVTNPDELIEPFIKAGADGLTVHYEATTHLDQILNRIKSEGKKSGVSLNPHTPVCLLEEILNKTDMILIMSVNPGYGGQKFIESSFEKVRKLRQMLDVVNSDVLIEIDGGVYSENVDLVVNAGVDILVAGTAVFGTKEPGKAFSELQETANKAYNLKLDIRNRV
jgi:ribulose-phosphate 3-epimerase